MEALFLEGEIAEHDQRVDVGRVEHVGLRGGGERALVVLEPLLGEAGRLRQEPRFLQRPFRHLHLTADELDRGADVAARGVGGAQRLRSRGVGRHRFERGLVALDGAVEIAGVFEQLGGADEVVGLGIGRGVLLHQRFDGLHRHGRVARAGAELGHRVERLRMARVDGEHALVGVERARGRADLLEQYFAARQEQLDAGRVIGHHAQVPLERRGDVLPAVERAVMTRQRGDRRRQVGVDGEDGLARLGGLLVVDELLFVERCQALVDADFLAR